MDEVMFQTDIYRKSILLSIYKDEVYDIENIIMDNFFMFIKGKSFSLKEKLIVILIFLNLESLLRKIVLFILERNDVFIQK